MAFSSKKFSREAKLKFLILSLFTSKTFAMEAGVAIGAFKVFSNTLSFFLFLHHAFFCPNCVEFHLLKCKCKQLFRAELLLKAFALLIRITKPCFVCKRCRKTQLTGLR